MLRSQITQLNCTEALGELFVGLTMLSSAIILLTLPGIDNAYTTQSTLMSTSTNSNSIAQQHTEHILDNLVISEYIPLSGQLAVGDYILLMDFTPFVTSIEGHSHIALKVPCNEDGTSKVTI